MSAVAPTNGAGALVPSNVVETVLPSREGSGANVGSGGSCGYCTNTRFIESRPAYPRQPDDDRAVVTNFFAAFEFGNAWMLSLTTIRPSLVPSSTPFPDAGPVASAASTPAAFEQPCSSASV